MLLLALALQFELADGGARVTASSPPPGAVLSLHVEGQQVPVFATVVKQADDSLVLTPSYSLAPGENYEARLSVDGKVLERKKYQMPLAPGPPPSVVRILPDRELTVPANLLKFQIEFDQPMREGIEIFDQIELMDAESGTPVVSPWRRQEMWSPDAKRFTLLIHPGRIKQGVNLRDEMGPVLRPGRDYRLQIGAGVRSLAGKTLGAAMTHAFRTGPELRQPVDPAAWELRLPETPGSPLQILTGRPLDPFIAARHLWVVEINDAGGESPVEITMLAAKNQSEFAITPAHGWKTGRYRLRSDEFLEDLAGNTPKRVFDKDLTEMETDPVALARDFSLRY